MLSAALAAFACFWGAGAALPRTFAWYRRKGMIARNYRGRRIPVSLGIFLWGTIACGYALRWLAEAVLRDAGAAEPGTKGGPAEGGEIGEALLLCASLGGVAFVGWFDDRFGEGGTKGLAGHWRRLRRDGVWTTGWGKAAAISMLALAFALETARAAHAGAGHALMQASRMLGGAALIALSANAANLLDVRPGRAIKGFLLMLAPSLGYALAEGAALRNWSALFLPALAGALALFRADARELAMLGDSGANLLGFAAGCAMWLFAPASAQAAALAALVLLHAAAERASLSGWIERVPLLRRLDEWGRRS